MKTARRQNASNKLTYADFADTGAQDCRNAFDRDMFDIDDRLTAEEIFDAGFDDSVRDTWMAQENIDEIEDDGLDPQKCYEEWREGFRRVALPRIRSLMEIEQRKRMEETEAYWLELVDKNDESEGFVENFPSAEEAFVALAGANKGAVYGGNLDGPDYYIAKTYWNDDQLQFAHDLGFDWPAKRREAMIKIFAKEREAVRRRTKLNPARRAGNPADAKSEEKAIAEYYRLVHLPNDPHAMEVARDLVEAHGLSLRTLSENERTFDYDPSEREDHGKDFAGWFDIGNGEVVEWSVLKWSRNVRHRPSGFSSTPRVGRMVKRAPLFECYYEIWKSKAIACDVCGGVQQGHTCCPPDAGPERGAFTRTFDLEGQITPSGRNERSIIAQVYGEKFAIDFAVETGWQIALLLKTLGAQGFGEGHYRDKAIVELVRTRNLTIPKSHLRKEQR